MRASCESIEPQALPSWVILGGLKADPIRTPDGDGFDSRGSHVKKPGQPPLDSQSTVDERCVFQFIAGIISVRSINSPSFFL